MVEAFEFFGGVPREVWWDNPTTVVAQIFKGRNRKLNHRYAALASHYTFEPLFCMPARGNEKPYAENRVYTLQRRWATPVPQVRDLAELNAYLRECCLKDRARTIAQAGESIGQRFEQDRSAAMPLPARRFDPCIYQPAKVDKYQTVRFDGNRYSLPRSYAFQTVTVKGYIDHLQFVSHGQVIVRHDRCYSRGEQILDPVHYLVTLSRRPAALDHAGVYRQWRLPAIFTELRQALEQCHGPSPGARQYIRVLQLLAEHPLTRVQQAIEHTRRRGLFDADRIRRQVNQLALGEDRPAERLVLPDDNTDLHVQVPRPDLSRFNQLLYSGEPNHV
jgi:hypothetical protein